MQRIDEPAATLAERIRRLDDGLRSTSAIARALATSTAYVRVVLRQRRNGESKHDVAYRSDADVKARRAAKMRREYNAVPAAERRVIRDQYCMEVLRSGGMRTAAERDRARSEAHAVVRKRGREILAGRRDGGGQTE